MTTFICLRLPILIQRIGDKAGQYVVGRNTLRLRNKIQNQAVAQHRLYQSLDLVERNGEVAGQESRGLGRQNQMLRRPRAPI